MSEWCSARHSGHNQIGTRMTSCSWVYFLHEQEGLSFPEIRTTLGFGNTIHFENLHRKARMAVEAARQAAAA